MMISLVKKDFLCMMPIMKKQICVSGIIFILVSMSMKNISFLSAMLIMSIVICLNSSFSYDEYAHFDAYALTLPIERKDIVKAKYMFFLGSILISALLAAVCSFIMNIFLKNEISELVAGLLGSILAFVPMALFTLPFMLKFGAEKGRNYIMIGYLVPFFAVMFGAPLLAKIGIKTPTEIEIIAIFAAIILAEIIIAVLSYKISVKIYNKRQF
ncbi:MAG: ABC-2 transporter permease [Oscillospiraceae bacterium]